MNRPLAAIVDATPDPEFVPIYAVEDLPGSVASDWAGMSMAGNSSLIVFRVARERGRLARSGRASGAVASVAGQNARRLRPRRPLSMVQSQ